METTLKTFNNVKYQESIIVVIVICNVFTHTRNAQDLSMHRSNKKRTNTKEHEDICVTVVEKYTVDGAKTFTLMK